MENASFEINGKAIGADEKPYVIAEAGVHHYNSLELAKEHVLQAAIAGADAIKFQTYSADRIAAKWAPTYWDAGSGVTQHDIFKTRSVLTERDYVQLFEYANALKIAFLSTPFDPDAGDMLHRIGMPAFKIASADLTNTMLLESVARYKKPVMMSTGAATLDEVAEAVELVRRYGAPIALLHCSLSYPTPVENANLGRLRLLANRFPGVVLGYSDHTQPQDSMAPCPISVALGARVIEKHFTLNKLLTEDDHYHSVDPQGLAQLVKDCRESFEMCANAQEMTSKEEAARAYARRSVVAAKDLMKGAVLVEGDLDCKRPGTGLAPSTLPKLIGRRLRRDLESDELVQLEDVEE